MPVRVTEASGRACASANPGAMTMYGPCSSTTRIMASVYEAPATPASVRPRRWLVPPPASPRR